ncbi:MAG: SDR family oxidoreductase [bacterium]
MSLVFITGAGKRIGRHLALSFAKAGWDIAVGYNESKEGAERVVEEILSFDWLRMTDLKRTYPCPSQEGIIQDYGIINSLDNKVRAIAVKVDVRNKEEIENAFTFTVEKLGIPDVLINNSGVFPEKMKLEDISSEIWDDTMNINLRGAFLTSQVFRKYAKKGSKIVNISSLGGLEVWSQRIPYNVSKAGLNHLTKALAREFAPDITVNTVCPGAIYVDDEPSETDKTLLDLNRIPMKRCGNPKDIFDAVYFFATCSDYITAQILTVDGGYHDAR